MKKDYRFLIPTHTGLSIIARSKKEAIEKFNKWVEEMAEIHQIDEMIIDEPDVIGKTVAAFGVAVYLPDDFKASPEYIVDINETEDKGKCRKEA